MRYPNAHYMLFGYNIKWILCKTFKFLKVNDKCLNNNFISENVQFHFIINLFVIYV